MSGAADMARWAITSGSLIQGHYCHRCLDILRRVVHITKWWTGYNWLLIISALWDQWHCSLHPGTS